MKIKNYIKFITMFIIGGFLIFNSVKAVTSIMVPQGGTGQTNFEVDSILIGNGLNKLATTTNNTASWDTTASYVNQDVTNGSSPTFLTPTISGLLWDGHTLASTTDIYALGTITTGTWNGTTLTDAYISNDLTITNLSGTNTGDQDISEYMQDSDINTLAKLSTWLPGETVASTTHIWADAYIDNDITVDWLGLQAYPSACSAGTAVTTIGDTLTCTAFYDSITDFPITAGNIIYGDINGAGTLLASSTEGKVLKIDANGFPSWGTDNNTTYVSSDFTHNDLTGVSVNEHLDWTLNVGTINTGNYIEDVPHTSISALNALFTSETVASTTSSNLNFINDAGYLTGNETITLSGEITGSGATAITTTIADNIIDEANFKINTPTDDYVLTASSTASGGITWAANSAGFSDPMTTRGDIIYRDSGNTTARLAVGTADQVLTSDGTDISWAAAGGGSSEWTDDGLLLYPTETSDVVVIGGSATTTTGNILESIGQSYFHNAGNSLDVQNTTDGTSNQVGIFRANNRATAADNDQGYLSFYGDDDLGDSVEFGRLTWTMKDITNTSKDSKLIFGNMSGNSLQTSAYIDYAGQMYASRFTGLLSGSVFNAGYVRLGASGDFAFANGLRGSGSTDTKLSITASNGLSTADSSVASVFIAPLSTEAGSGNHPLISGMAIKPTVVSAGSATVSDTASLYIEGAATTTVVSGQNYALWVDDVNQNGETISRIDGKLIVGATSTSPFTFSVQGSALADDWLTYSPAYSGNALDKIKNIKCEVGSKKDDWCDIDHNSLPAGVRVEKEVIIGKKIIGYEPMTSKNWDEEKQATTTNSWDEPIMEDIKEMQHFRSVDKQGQFNLKAIQELYDLTLQQQAEIVALKMRINEVDGLGVEPVIVDKKGNLLSEPLWIGFGAILTGLIGAWFIKQKKK